MLFHFLCTVIKQDYSKTPSFYWDSKLNPKKQQLDSFFLISKILLLEDDLAAFKTKGLARSLPPIILITCEKEAHHHPSPPNPIVTNWTRCDSRDPVIALHTYRYKYGCNRRDSMPSVKYDFTRYRRKASVK